MFLSVVAAILGFQFTEIFFNRDFFWQPSWIFDLHDKWTFNNLNFSYTQSWRQIYFSESSIMSESQCYPYIIIKKKTNHKRYTTDNFNQTIIFHVHAQYIQFDTRKRNWIMQEWWCWTIELHFFEVVFIICQEPFVSLP